MNFKLLFFYRNRKTTKAIRTKKKKKSNKNQLDKKKKKKKVADKEFWNGSSDTTSFEASDGARVMNKGFLFPILNPIRAPFKKKKTKNKTTFSLSNSW